MWVCIVTVYYKGIVTLYVIRTTIQVSVSIPTSMQNGAVVESRL